MNSGAALPEFASSSRLLSLRQAMELLNCKSRTTMGRYVKRGWLRPIKMGSERSSPVKFRYDEIVWSLDNMRKG